MEDNHERRGWTFTDKVAFRLRLSRRIDLRCALVVPQTSLLPSSVNQAFRRHRCKHVLNESRRCVAFALGSVRAEADGPVWYILTLQSDIAFCPSSRLRDYVRGWRTCLFEAILQHAKAANVPAVALPRARDVARAATWWGNRLTEDAPASWRSIYDGTAAQFGLRIRTIPVAVDLQLMPRRPATPCCTFFVKELAP